MAEHKYPAKAQSIFRATDSDFHGHRPAVWMNQHLYGIFERSLCTLAQRSDHPASPALLTRVGPLIT
eukprot:maker-scaffold_149-snap-gene-0.9-mRNA-1 protein AED:0.47 eAED:0.47 QI:0/0/0/1/0/0/2/0/66